MGEYCLDVQDAHILDRREHIILGSSVLMPGHALPGLGTRLLEAPLKSGQARSETTGEYASIDCPRDRVRVATGYFFNPLASEDKCSHRKVFHQRSAARLPMAVTSVGVYVSTRIKESGETKKLW